MRKLTRLEANKEVRRVLNRHGVDLGYCQYSVAGADIRLCGWLCKHDSSDFSGTMIEGMIQEFMRVLPGFTISGAFDNWSFSSDHVTFLGEKETEEQGSYFEETAGEEDYEGVG